MNDQQPSVEFVSNFDPYVYQTLASVVGGRIVVQLSNNSVVKGVLKEVMPDHVVVETNGTPFYVRIQQIIWVSPASHK
ncbi:YuzF family protein [Paenisporosarcina sp.]|jgi:hypothetical protein|uniref:YuzF family protein n=1 Tax=unclassified Paenisporosarcina TaxID=2642018 RepID=UPI003C74ECFD